MRALPDSSAHLLTSPLRTRVPFPEYWRRDSTGQNTYEWIKSIAAVISLARAVSAMLGSTVATPYAYI